MGIRQGTLVKIVPIFCLIVPSLRAEVVLPSVFGDHMVLQQGTTLPIWGKASAGETVRVRIAGRRGETVANESGDWRVTLRPLPKSSTPLTLLVEGSNHLEIHDVLVGDVWLCAGEGNMAFPVSRSSTGGGSADSIAESGIRFFLADHVATKTIPQHPLGSGHWIRCTAETLPDLPAVAYFFARDVASSQHLPVGIISCTREGAPLSSWISSRGIGMIGEAASSPNPSARDVEKSPPAGSSGASAEGNSPGEFPPSSVFNGMISPLIPYALTGFIWYQGESDEGVGALQYRRLFPQLVRDWRGHWGEGPVPFYFVSLAGFGDRDDRNVESYHDSHGRMLPGWPWIREGTACALTLPNTGMAVVSDLGDDMEKCPSDKLNVGRRLALLARHRVYGEEVVDQGPAYKSMKVEGDKLRITFDSIGGGLVLGMPPSLADDAVPVLSAKLRGFFISGDSRKWYPAHARIEGADVVLWSDGVEKPIAARYGWNGFPTGNLYNREGLPAAPFRTDSSQPD